MSNQSKKPFVVGDRVAVYAQGKRHQCTVTEIDDGPEMMVQEDRGRGNLYVHAKQCRRLVKKRKPVAREYHGHWRLLVDKVADGLYTYTTPYLAFVPTYPVDHLIVGTAATLCEVLPKK